VRTRDVHLVTNVGLELVGANVEVPCADGSLRRYVDLDSAASTPALRAVAEAVAEFLPWYSSVHRGTGFKSIVSTDVYEHARSSVASFLDCAPGHAVVFVRNTTEATNLLAAALPSGTRILSSACEHHANMLPWRGHELELLPFTSSADELLSVCETALARRRFDLLAVTGASNVTGEVWPVAELASLAHRHGARIFVDAAQLAPHRPVSLRALGADFAAISGHKLYAPFGAGALVVATDALDESVPLLHGGGAVKVVTLEDVAWSSVPDRFEAGSPNVVGAVALGAACEALAAFGMERIRVAEQALAERLFAGLDALDGAEVLRLWPGVDRVGVAAFCVRGVDHSLVATALSAEWGIGVRSGSFCAHPLVARLLGIDREATQALLAKARAGEDVRIPGAVRASLGIGVREEDVDLFLDALSEIATHGPRAQYRFDPLRREYAPVTDLRQLPQLSCASSGRSHGSRR
jgi:selenocysteine lyase/cysteine desulfurase